MDVIRQYLYLVNVPLVNLATLKPQLLESFDNPSPQDGFSVFGHKYNVVKMAMRTVSSMPPD